MNTEKSFLNSIDCDHKEYLFKTDWYVIRFLETGVAIPADIAEARVAARAAALANET